MSFIPGIVMNQGTAENFIKELFPLVSLTVSEKSLKNDPEVVAPQKEGILTSDFVDLYDC